MSNLAAVGLNVDVCGFSWKPVNFSCLPNVLDSESFRSARSVGSSVACRHLLESNLHAAFNMMSYKMLLVVLVTLAVPASTQTSEVHGMQLQLTDLPTEFGSFEVCYIITSHMDL